MGRVGEGVGGGGRYLYRWCGEEAEWPRVKIRVEQVREEEDRGLRVIGLTLTPTLTPT